ncbi:polyketide cyclase [Streptomyces sp. Ru73]|uniref:type II toxin-antitoxin system Rv0910 family toxin n=1 Tax=Streptomyces sp. Ru73 TaxID=2080748 RepID=UPI000CDDA61F|nr:SRPBCC family protein [Streptomyces sp. Ru73]POX36152.1 polyketide cyclase [Streptomyces sp. Ru73]
MADVTAQARIAAPPDKIWRYLTDFDSYGQWNATHTSFPEGGPATLEPGASYAENMKLMSFPAEVTWTVQALEPGRLLDIQGKGPMGVSLRMRYALTPEGGANAGGAATAVGEEDDTSAAGATTVRIDGSFTGAAVALMAGKLKDSAKSALDESLGKLAGLVG